MTRRAVSKHLRILTEANLVSFEKTGRETRFRLEIANQFINEVAIKWDNAPARLMENLETN